MTAARRSSLQPPPRSRRIDSESRATTGAGREKRVVCEGAHLMAGRGCRIVVVAMAVAGAAEHAVAGFVFTEIRRRVSAGIGAVNPEDSQYILIESDAMGVFDESAVVVDSDGFGFSIQTSSITSDSVVGQFSIAGQQFAPDISAGGFASLVVVFRLDTTTTVFVSSPGTSNGIPTLDIITLGYSWLFNSDNPDLVLAGGDSVTFSPQVITLPPGEYTFGLSQNYGISDRGYGFAQFDLDFELTIIPAPAALALAPLALVLGSRRRRR